MSDQERSSAASNVSKFGTGALRPGTVQVTVGKNVTQADLHRLIDTVIGQHGCMACGLGGIDLIIRQQDPRIIEAFEHIPEVKEVTVYR